MKHLALALLTLLAVSAGLAQSNLFPFVVPWDIAPSGVADLSGLLHRPAGKLGYVRIGSDGHFYVGTQRIRFCGMNMSMGACFPPHDVAPQVALRLAKAGVNVVRFMGMEHWNANPSLIDYSRGNSRHLNAVSLDRLDFFLAQLKAVGVYGDLELVSHRLFSSGDGLPSEIDSLDWQIRQAIGVFYEPIIELEKEYARLLLTHRNPYTGLTYAEDPAVAFVEIKNENGLVSAFFRGWLDNLPPVFRSDLRRQWNEWLLAKYGSTEALRVAWGERNEPLGNEMLINGDYTNGLNGWQLEQHGGAQAISELSNDAPAGFTYSARIQVTVPGSLYWHVQWSQPWLRVEEGQLYTLSFWARADTARDIRALIAMAHAPWWNLGVQYPVSLTTSWQRFEFPFIVDQSDTNARVLFSKLGLQIGTYWIAGVSLRPGGTLRIIPEDQSLESRSVEIVFYRDWTVTQPTVRRDWLRFLYDTERRYWRTLYGYLKNELGVRALITGTSVGWSSPNLMVEMDYIDTHAYWQHPVFPGQSWDPNNWYIYNLSMVNSRSGTLERLARKRVYGKPIVVSEYNHPAPNTFNSEGLLIAAAYALLQDWDALYFYTFGHRWDNLDARRITGFFDIHQHPTQWIALLPAAAMFLRGDVAPAQTLVAAPLNREREIDHSQRFAWGPVDGSAAGLNGLIARLHRAGIVTEGQTMPPGALSPDQVNTNIDRFVSDTGQLVWDMSQPERGVITIATPRTKAVIGYGAGRQFDLGDGVLIEPGSTHQNGFSVLTLTVKQGRLSSRGVPKTQLLITATGYVQNTDWGWEELGDNRVTLRNNWGTPPTLVEGIPARITLPMPSDVVQAWALDERGARRTRLPVTSDANGRAVLEIGPQYQTLWYEVLVQPLQPVTPVRYR